GETVSAAAEWSQVNLDIDALAERIGDRKGLALRTGRIVELRGEFIAALDVLLGDLKAGQDAAIAVGSGSTASIVALGQTLRGWVAGSEQLSKWVAYSVRADTAGAAGMADLAARLHDG